MAELMLASHMGDYPAADARLVTLDPDLYCDFGAWFSHLGFDPCPQPFVNCSDHADIHKTPGQPYKICTRCRKKIISFMSTLAQPVFWGPVYTKDRLTGNVISFLSSPDIPGLPLAMPRRRMTPLCKICTEDEIFHYKSRVDNPQYAALYPARANSEKSFQNECTCLNRYLRKVKDSCLSCTRADFTQCFSDCLPSLEFLQHVGRTREGYRATASNHGANSLVARRIMAQRPIACRCGREVRPTAVRIPSVLCCMTCAGTWIDPSQVSTRRTRRAGVDLPVKPKNLRTDWPFVYRMFEDDADETVDEEVFGRR